MLFGFVEDEDEDEEIQPKEKERKEVTEKKLAKRCWMKTIINFSIATFTVTGGNEAGFDLALIQPSLLYHVNHAVLMLSSIF